MSPLSGRRAVLSGAAPPDSGMRRGARGHLALRGLQLGGPVRVVGGAMDGQNVWVWVVVAAVVLLVLGIGLLLAGRRYQRIRTAALRRRFGTEYERVVGER